MVDHDAALTHYRGVLGRLEDEAREPDDLLSRAANGVREREATRGVRQLDAEITRLQEEDHARR